MSNLNDQNVFIDSAEAIKNQLKNSENIGVKKYTVAKIMREDLGMRYKKLRAVSFKGNSERNQILRQQFAMKFIEVLEKGKTILNVDETWLGMGDFRRRKWQAPNSTNSVAKLNVVPRISMITALDTNGKVYVSLVQSNSNSKIMEIFFHKLVLKLNQEN